MSNPVTIAPGASPTLLGSAVAAGTTISNQDSKNAVWVSALPSITPGYGTKLGALGSLEWSSNNSPVYAILDAASTTPLTVTLDADVTNIDNPVAVGSAVAAQLLTQGVPSVFLGKLIYNQNMVTGGGVQPLAGLDFSQYASITVCISFPPGTFSQVAYTWQDNANGVYFGGRKLTVSGGNTGVTFTADVKGPDLFINCVSGALVQIYGTNRALGDHVLNVDPQAEDNTGNIAQAVNTKTYYTATLTTDGGAHYLRMNVSTGGKGYLCYSSVDVAGVKTLHILTDSGNSHAAPVTGVEINTMVNIPPGRLEFCWLSEVAATYAATFTIIPNS